ncbi:MAG: glycoside hydrolase TIM-barrel-like domain-containing protein [Proteobacteria bacterium]|nr:glycoside hydrolase TIM-barrel-like domain-containing protein [Pseudomonadota bacterium]
MQSILLKSAVGAVKTAITRGGDHISIEGIATNFGRNILTQLLDHVLHGKPKHKEGRRLSELMLQSSSYEKAIPVLYGVARVAGNIIWADRPKERKKVIKSGHWLQAAPSRSEYSYSISLAIAVAEGPISSIYRIWVDDMLFDAQTAVVRIYSGNEEQKPDPLIEKVQGVGQTPAYRGLAYVVLEDLDLTPYNNRIPNFTFEVQRVLPQDKHHPRAEDLVRSVIIIPGSGEFVYDTTVQYKQNGDLHAGQFLHRGPGVAVNKHTAYAKADAIVALDDMRHTLPNLEWVAPVVGWFGTSLDIGYCSVKPGVEYKHESNTTPRAWRVAEYTRSSAHLITQTNGRPIYGGTTDDQAVLNYLIELRARGYKIMFYPILFMDLLDKPWRGRMYGSSFSVHSFFNKQDGYKNFIRHYARLVVGKVDAFVIGSEMVGLNKISGIFTSYPAVNEWIELAQEVKQILGENTLVTYAADWSEYHHTDGGWHHLDPLWACDAIDMVGIDAYFPLTEGKRSSSPKLADIIKGWDSGEGYDYYYKDEARTIREPLESRYAWKNLRWWWENIHVDPNGMRTNWQPKSKKIWFTEYGFPSVNCASNQPNVFWSEDSVESHLPRDSDGQMSVFAQRQGIAATEMRWGDSEMVERRFLWTWDARPFPFWPELKKVWSDGFCWYRGHWVQGKLGALSLAQVILDLCIKAGLRAEMVDISALHEVLVGFVIAYNMSVKEALEELQKAYFFDVSVIHGVVHFIPRANKQPQVVNYSDMLPMSGIQGNVDIISQSITSQHELPGQVVVQFIDRYSDYQISAQHAEIQTVSGSRRLVMQLPLVLPPEQAAKVAELTLHSAWSERYSYNFRLPPLPQYMLLAIADVLLIQREEDQGFAVRITGIRSDGAHGVEISGVRDNMAMHQERSFNQVLPFKVKLGVTPPPTVLEVLDIPLLATESMALEQGRFMVAACGVGENWRGAAVFADTQQPGDLVSVGRVYKSAVIGRVLGKLWPTPHVCTIDRVSRLYVNILSGELASAGEHELGIGCNTALVGEEIIQFQHARQTKPYQYELYNLVRGRYGTEGQTAMHKEEERFVLLDDSLLAIPLSADCVGQSLQVGAVSLGAHQDDGPATALTQLHYTAKALLPFSPVHLQVRFTKMPSLVLQWYRRSRLSGRANNSWSRGVDLLGPVDRTALGEIEERYRVSIYSGESLVYSAICDKPEYRLDSADWRKYGLPEEWDVLVIKVVQLSSKLGPGAAAILKLDSHGRAI